MNYTKYRDFKKSKLNTVLNMLTPLFYCFFIGALILYGVMVMVFIGASMWRRGIEFDNVLSYNSNVETSETKLYVDTYEDDKLYVRYGLSCEVIKDLEFRNYNDYTIYKVVCDDAEVIADNNIYSITAGNHDIIFYISKITKLDEYNNCRTIDLTTDADEIIVSDFFKPVDKESTHKRLQIYTADSTGEYVPIVKRNIIYKILVFFFFFANTYCLFIIVKAIVLKIKIKQEIKLEAENQKL